MNLLQRLNGILKREQRGIAKITGELGGSRFAALSQGGRQIVLDGQAATGQRVFYDMTTNRIVGVAPNVDMTDIAV